MTKRVIRLTEKQLRNIITESVTRILNENNSNLSFVKDPSVIEAFVNWMNRNNIQCGYFDWDMDEKYVGATSFGRTRVKVPKYEVQVPEDQMLSVAVEYFCPSEYSRSNESLIQWFDEDAPGLDIEKYTEYMNESAQEEYEEKISGWYDHMEGQREYYENSREEDRRLGY